MSPTQFALFDTAIGACALAWRGDAIVRAALPERSMHALRSRFAKRFTDAAENEPTPAIARAISAIQVLLVDGRGDLGSIKLDLSEADAFEQQVYGQTRAIPPGEVKTYGEIASALGDKTLSRAVGKALGANPIPIIVPCHRVLAASGKTGGFSAPGGVDTKMRMLTIERARTTDVPMLFDDLGFARRIGR